MALRSIILGNTALNSSSLKINCLLVRNPTEKRLSDRIITAIKNNVKTKLSSK